MCEVTIAIALYNLEDYIEDSLKSALDQDFEDLEILVCNDCSTDKSLEVVKRVCENHVNGNKVRVISPQKNSKTAFIRNMAIDQAKGKYLLFLDGDDILAPGAISLMYNMIKKSKANIVIGNLYNFENDQNLSDEKLNGKKILHFKEQIVSGKYAIAKFLENNHTNYYPMATMNKLFDLQFIRENKIRCIPEHGVVEDNYFTFQCQLKATSIAAVSETTLYYRLRNGSAVHSNISFDRMELYIKIFELIYNNLQKEQELNSPNKIPVQLYYNLTRPYLYGYVTSIVLSSNRLRARNKSYFLKQISKIRKLDFTSKDMVSRLNRIVYFLLQFRCRYWLIKSAFKAFRILGKDF